LLDRFDKVNVFPISFLYSVKRLVLNINLSDTSEFLVNHLTCFKRFTDEFKILSNKVELKNLFDIDLL